MIDDCTCNREQKQANLKLWCNCLVVHETRKVYFTTIIVKVPTPDMKSYFSAEPG